MDAVFVERARTGLRVWIGAKFGENLRAPNSPLVEFEAQFPGITSHTITQATEIALSSYDRDFEESRQYIIAYLATAYNEQYLTRLAAFAGSSGGAKLFGFALSHGFASPEQPIAVQSTEADFASFERSFTDAERRAHTDVQNRPGDPQLGDVLDGIGNRYSLWMRGYFQRKSSELSTAAQQAAQAYIASSRGGRRQ